MFTQLMLNILSDPEDLTLLSLIVACLYVEE